MAAEITTAAGIVENAGITRDDLLKIVENDNNLKEIYIAFISKHTANKKFPLKEENNDALIRQLRSFGKGLINVSNKYKISLVGDSIEVNLGEIRHIIYGKYYKYTDFRIRVPINVFNSGRTIEITSNKDHAHIQGGRTCWGSGGTMAEILAKTCKFDMLIEFLVDQLISNVKDSRYADYMRKYRINKW